MNLQAATQPAQAHSVLSYIFRKLVTIRVNPFGLLCFDGRIRIKHSLAFAAKFFFAKNFASAIGATSKRLVSLSHSVSSSARSATLS